MSELCSALRAMGYDARLLFLEDIPKNKEDCENLRETYVVKGVKLFVKIILWRLLPFKWIETRFNLKPHFPPHARGRRVARLPFFSRKRTIVIYPETVYGNPLGAENVVRWQLYHYMYKSDPSAFSKSDLFIGYREVFNDRNFTPQIENFYIQSFDSSLYRRYNFGQRSGKCFIVRKGYCRCDLPDEFDGMVIDNLPEEEKVEVFNRCEYCYSYDTQTFLSSIAAICGCKSIVVPEPGKSRSDYRGENENSFGVAWSDSPEEISRAQSSVPLLQREIEASDEDNRVTVKRLVSLLEDNFKTRINRIGRR